MVKVKPVSEHYRRHGAGRNTNSQRKLLSEPLDAHPRVFFPAHHVQAIAKLREPRLGPVSDNLSAKTTFRT